MTERLLHLSPEKLLQTPEETRLRVALALGAGGALGCAHVGVIRALQELGIQIDAVAGSSMGALVGAFLAEGKLDELEKFLNQTTLRTIRQYLNFPKKSGKREWMNSRAIGALLRSELGHRKIEEMAMPYAAMTMEWGTWKSIPLREGDLVGAILASSSIPFLFSKKEHDGRTLVDGGFSSLVPLPMARELSNEKVIAVGVSRRIPIVAQVRKKLAESQWGGDRPEVDLHINLDHGGAARFDQARKFMDTGYRSVMGNKAYILDALSGEI